LSGVIYKIVNGVTGDFYIGSSCRFSLREGEHRRLARKGEHHSIIFQRAWDKYGEDVFNFIIIEKCETGVLLEREQHYFDTLGPKYNISKVAGAPNPPPNKPIIREDVASGVQVEFRTRDDAAEGGFNEGEITACCLGRAGTHKGHYWYFADGSTPAFNSNERSRPVKRIDIATGEELHYASMALGAADGYMISGISACCLGKQKKHRGSYWFFANDEVVIPDDGKEGFFKERCKGGGPGAPVDRIDLATGAIVTYKNMAEAAREGFTQTSISKCCLGDRNTHSGYTWRFHDPSNAKIDISKVCAQNTFKIVRISEDGTEKVYDNFVAIKADGFNSGNVHSCCKGWRGKHGGYKWQYVGNPNVFNNKVERAVIGTSVNSGEQVTYNSAAATAVDGFWPQKVGACCQGRRKTHKGYKWEYA